MKKHKLSHGWIDYVCAFQGFHIRLDDASRHQLAFQIVNMDGQLLMALLKK